MGNSFIIQRDRPVCSLHCVSFPPQSTHLFRLCSYFWFGSSILTSLPVPTLLTCPSPALHTCPCPNNLSLPPSPVSRPAQRYVFLSIIFLSLSVIESSFTYSLFNSLTFFSPLPFFPPHPQILSRCKYASSFMSLLAFSISKLSRCIYLHDTHCCAIISNSITSLQSFGVYS